LGTQCLDGHEGSDHPIGAVETPAEGLTVEMRSGHDRRALAVGLAQNAVEVADRVDPYLIAPFQELLPEPVSCSAVIGAAGLAIQAAGRCGAEFRNFVHHALQHGWIDLYSHAVTSWGASAGWRSSRWHAAWSMPPRLCRTGFSRRQRSKACGQREAKAQPTGRLIGLGGSPSSRQSCGE